MAKYPEKVWLNGEILDTQNAKVSVFDRGFIFGDGIYEVMVQIDGSFFYAEQHLERLDSCLKKVAIDFKVEQIPAFIDRLLEATRLVGRNCLLYIQISRGVAPRQHAFPKTVPTLMMYAVPFMLPDINEKKLKTVTRPDLRWSRCDIKMTSLLGNVMANEEAASNDCYETLLIRDGVVTEASHCNVFFVKNGIVYTHPANNFILDGITRRIVIQLCKDLNIAVEEVGVLEKDIVDMDEAFLTGTTTQIASIQKIDEFQFYSGDRVGPITRMLQTAFLELKQKHYGPKALL